MEKKSMCNCNEPPNPHYWHILPKCPVHDHPPTEAEMGREIAAFIPCHEDDPRICGSYTSLDGQCVGYVRESNVPVVEQGAVWVNVGTRLPEMGETVLIEYRSRDLEYKVYKGPEDWWKRNVRRWLDEGQPQLADAIAFAEWAATVACFDSSTKLWELIGEGEAIDGQFRFTTKEFIEVFNKEARP